MEQRPLRLGDILDDYCPRERRVTNHAIVALVDEDIKQTRCTTCDAEHVYKGGKAPRRKKAETTGRLYKEVLAGLTDDVPAPTLASAPHVEREAEPDSEPESREQTIAVAPDDSAMPAAEETESIADGSDDEGPLHRPLIRATLPRPEGIKVERQIPEFTIRQNSGRNGNFRDARGKARGHGGGHAGHGGHGGPQGHQRFGRGPQGRPGPNGGGRGAASGFGRPGGGQRHGGPRKRSR